MHPKLRSSRRVVSAATGSAKSTEEPPKKKQRKSVGGTRVSRPCKKNTWLDKIGGVPADVMLEICSHMLPLDLLNMIRTTKYLRDLLLQHSSAAVWRAARDNVPHSDMYMSPPGDMSEPAYARLIFDTRCHFCNAARVKHPFWTWRVRCCKSCLPEAFGDGRKAFKTPLATKHEHLYYPTEIEPKHTRLYLLSAVQEFHDLLEQAQLVGEEEAFLQERAALVSSLNKRGEEEKSLAKTREALRGCDLNQIRAERVEAVRQKLREIGWKDEINLMAKDDYSLHRAHDDMYKATPLTDRAWNKMKESLIKCMEDVQIGRIRNEHIDLIIGRQELLLPLLRAYRQSRTPQEIVPGDGDIVLMAPFAEILESDDTVVVETRDFSSAISLLPELCAKWREETDQHLLSLFPESAARAKSDLNLATTQFSCSGCRNPISYPRILSHKCMTENSLSRYMYSAMHRHLKRRFCSAESFPFNREEYSLNYDTKAAEAASNILRACGDDPFTTTAAHMDRSSRTVRLTCDCTFGPLAHRMKAHPLMNWRRAIEHASSSYIPCNGSWKVINSEASLADQEYLTLTHDLEAEFIRKRTIGFWAKHWACKQCITFRGSIAGVEAHLQQEHGLAPGEITEDHYFRHLDAPPSLGFEFFIADGSLETIARLVASNI